MLQTTFQLYIQTRQTRSVSVRTPPGPAAAPTTLTLACRTHVHAFGDVYPRRCLSSLYYARPAARRRGEASGEANPPPVGSRDPPRVARRLPPGLPRAPSPRAHTHSSTPWYIQILQAIQPTPSPTRRWCASACVRQSAEYSPTTPPVPMPAPPPHIGYTRSPLRAGSRRGGAGGGHHACPVTRCRHAVSSRGVVTRCHAGTAGVRAANAAT